jgi:hypothetical protein
MKPLPTEEQLRETWEKHRVDDAVIRGALARIPPSWTLIEEIADGAAFRRGSLQVLFSVSHQPNDDRVWIHVSVCGRTGRDKYYLPSWEELKRVKNDFIGDDRWAYQVLPPQTQYVNDHPFVLHLFATLDGAPALPDFTQGLGHL